MTSRRAARVLIAGALLGQPPGGVRRHNNELLPRAARALQERGGRLAVLAGREGLRLESRGELEILESGVPAGPPLRRAWAEGPALRRALAEARREGRPFDLVHTGHLPAPRRLGVPYTLTLHDLRRLAHRPGRWLSRPVLASAIGRAAGVVTVSQSVHDQLVSLFEPRHATIVHNAADHLPLQPRRREPQEPFLLHVGHVEPRKNLALLLRALALRPSLPPLHLVGAAKGTEEQRLRRLARKLGVEPRLRWLGALSDAELPRLYATCSAAVFPSRLEGFGIGTLEAMRAGAPVAIARAGALPEITGNLAPSFSTEDPDECARAIERALGMNDDELSRTRERARAYSWSAGATSLVDFWSEMSSS